MKHNGNYDALCRALTDYEGYGTDDEDVIGNIEYVVDELEEISNLPDINEFVQRTIERTIDINNTNRSDDDIYDLGCRIQNTWDDIWGED